MKNKNITFMLLFTALAPLTITADDSGDYSDELMLSNPDDQSNFLAMEDSEMPRDMSDSEMQNSDNSDAQIEAIINQIFPIITDVLEANNLTGNKEVKKFNRELRKKLLTNYGYETTRKHTKHSKKETTPTKSSNASKKAHFRKSTTKSTTYHS